MEKTDEHQTAMASRIRELRQSRGMSITDFARLLRVTRQAVYSMENGTRKIRVDEISILSKEFDITLAELYGESVSTPVAGDGPCTAIEPSDIEDFEYLIAHDLSRLNPGTLDRILRLVGPIRAARREFGTGIPRTSSASRISSVIQRRLDRLLRKNWPALPVEPDPTN